MQSCIIVSYNGMKSGGGGGGGKTISLKIWGPWPPGPPGSSAYAVHMHDTLPNNVDILAVLF